MIEWGMSALILFGLLALTLAFYGLVRLPDLYTRLHVVGVGAVLGVMPLLLASLGTRDFSIIARACLIGGFLLFTAPVSAHVIARAAYRTEEPFRAGEVVDEVKGGRRGN